MDSQPQAEPPALSCSSSSPGTSLSSSPGTPPRSPAQHRTSPTLRQSPRHKLHSPPRLALENGIVKGKTPPKARRKKTLPEDKAILEAAYEQNPTPDKAARRELVRRCIDMSEARIQIWFQNRRQIDRRKSEPVPSKVEAFTHGRIQVLSPNMVVQKNKSFELDNLAVAAPPVDVPQPMLPSSSTPGLNAPVCPAAASSGPAQETPGPHSSQGSSVWSSSPALPDASAVARPSLTRSFSATTTGYLANRRNLSSLLAPSQSQSSFRSEPFPSSCPNPASSGAAAEPAELRPSSQPARLCLSLSLDGRAEITESTISPPRPRPTRPEGADAITPPSSVRLPPLQLFPDAASASKHPRRSLPSMSSLDSILSRSMSVPRDPRSSLKYVLDPIGRSPSLRRCRSSDVHAWEACATSQNLEDPLIQQAKHESSGSAVAAINLVRSTSALSTSSILKQRSANAKRRTSLQPGSAKRHKSDLTSMGSSRMRGVDAVFGPGEKRSVANAQASGPAKGSSTAADLYANDSDKENWSPDEDGVPRPRYTTSSFASGRRPLPSAAPSSFKDGYRNPRRTSGYDSPRAAPSLLRGSTSPGGWSRYARRYRARPSLPSRSQSALEIYEDSDNDDDNEEEEGSHKPPRDGSGDDSRPDPKELLSSIGDVGSISPSKEKDVAAATGLLSLKWGR
ncbi:hypothetical protein VTJ83DRAFT_277 [Remersonia thermophila]|uniref:Homeobox domain-containing protein n=1 Tax=Remersonia thermophila TaxID=72144 RepID=A0ABR4DM27_9PEZI